MLKFQVPFLLLVTDKAFYLAYAGVLPLAIVVCVWVHISLLLSVANAWWNFGKAETKIQKWTV